MEEERREAEEESPVSEAEKAEPDGESLDAEVEAEPPEVEATPEARIVELEAELAATNDRMLRLLAETENIRRRTEREREDTLRYAAGGLAKDLLNVADNLHRALAAVPEEMREGDEAAKNFVIGVEMTEKELLAGFEKHGIQQILPLGEKFDYEKHQAMFELENTGQPPGTVVELMQPGYVMHERLLRPAMVGVAKGKADDSLDDIEHIDTTA
jgi:molecular chaperone GrpE